MYTQINLINKPHNLKTQTGAALILMAFILGLGVAAYLIKTFNSQAIQQKQDEKTMQSLNQAKEALIAWSVSHQYTPGQMPWPDRNSDGNYDGSSDCVANSFQNSFFIGQLPSMPATSPCVDPNTGNTVYTGLSTYPGLGQAFTDAFGNRLWYAVSKNLVRNYTTADNPVINPSLANSATWLKVLDRNGKLISDRVAVVIIAPNLPIGDQDRSSNAPNAIQFLDSFEIGAQTYSNRTYGLLDDEDFIIGEDSRNVSANDLTFVRPYNFNDKLVYITIDELIVALEKRVARTAEESLLKYKISTGNYPYAAIMGGHKNYSCVNNRFAGALPIAPSHSSNCTYSATGSASTTTCDFSEIDTVTFTKSGASFNSRSGACEIFGTKCICSGDGSCSRGADEFSCNTSGVCTANMSGTYHFSGGAFDNVTGQCSSSCGTEVTCSSSGAGDFSHSACSDSPFNDATTNSVLPTWFTANNWQDYMYYHAKRDTSPDISAGSKSGVGALLITTGSAISTPPFTSKGSAQVRLSCELSDYLDTATNVSGNVTGTYESTNKQRSLNYNDQVFIIAP